MRTHILKTWTEYFERVESGQKRFEVRKNDRDFQVGDTVILQEYDQKEDFTAGNQLTFTISYILPGGQFGIEPGYCVFGLTP